MTVGRHGAKNFLMRDGKEVVQCVFYENVSSGKILLFRMWLCFIKEQWQISHINLPWHSSASMCCCYPRMMNISIIFSICSLNLEAFTSNQTTKIWRNYWIPFDTGYMVAPLPFHESLNTWENVITSGKNIHLDTMINWLDLVGHYDPQNIF